MIYRSESKFQGWRALAIFEDRSECLLFLGRSSSQVREGYVAAFHEILDEEERGRVERISLQRWEGAADEGRWLQQTTLSLPQKKVERVLSRTA